VSWARSERFLTGLKRGIGPKVSDKTHAAMMRITTPPVRYATPSGPSARCHVVEGGLSVFHFENVDSTNDAAKRLFGDGSIRSRSLVIARGQTAGRGTRERRWISPRDAGIYMTLIEPSPPALSLRCLEDYTVAAGVACVETIRSQLGVDAVIQGINDVFCWDRKLGGVLTEAIVEGNRPCGLFVGVGINTRTADRPIDPPSPLAISLEDVMDAAAFSALDADALARSLATAVFAWLDAVGAGDVDRIRHRLQSLRQGE